MHGPIFGEFMGTMVLIVLGDGVVANVLLKKSKGENSGWIVISTAWGMAVVAGICTAVACGSPGAHINPAITLAVAILSKNWSNVGPFWLAQILEHLLAPFWSGLCTCRTGKRLRMPPQSWAFFAPRRRSEAFPQICCVKPL
jgi:glycerol uptake facilitator-like aquaporin